MAKQLLGANNAVVCVNDGGNNTVLLQGKVEVDDDLKCYGDTADNYMLWDASADKLIINSTDDNDCIQLISTDADNAQGPTIIFERSSVSPDDDDNLGACVFKGQNDTAETITFAQLTSFLPS